MGELRLSDSPDKLYWKPGKGNFTVKAFSNQLSLLTQGTSGHRGIQLEIWKAKIPPKITIFLWKLNWGILPTNSFISKRIMSISDKCGWCNCANESLNLFWLCSIARWAWDFVVAW